MYKVEVHPNEVHVRDVQGAVRVNRLLVPPVRLAVPQAMGSARKASEDNSHRRRRMHAGDVPAAHTIRAFRARAVGQCVAVDRVLNRAAEGLGHVHCWNDMLPRLVQGIRTGAMRRRSEALCHDLERKWQRCSVIHLDDVVMLFPRTCRVTPFSSWRSEVPWQRFAALHAEGDSRN